MVNHGMGIVFVGIGRVQVMMLWVPSGLGIKIQVPSKY